jgi:hypothetical protein
MVLTLSANRATPIAHGCAWLLIVDYAASGQPLGIEITAPQAVPLDRLDQLLKALGEPPLSEQDYRPARAA